VKDYDTGLRIVPDPSIAILKSSCSVVAVLHRKHYGNPNSFNQWCNPFSPQHMDSNPYLLHRSLPHRRPLPLPVDCVRQFTSVNPRNPPIKVYALRLNQLMEHRFKGSMYIGV